MPFGNHHNQGLSPSLQSVRALGFDVRFRETHDRHRLFQALDTTKALLGTVGDANYNGFFIQADALAYLAADATWQAAVTANGGLQDYVNDDSFPIVSDSGNSGINANFTYGQELANP